MSYFTLEFVWFALLEELACRIDIEDSSISDVGLGCLSFRIKHFLATAPFSHLGL